MNRIWKWIIGILIVVVVAALLAVPFTMHRFALFNNFAGNLPQERGWYSSPMMPGWNNGPRLDDGDGWRHPMMPGWQGDFNYRRSPMFGGGFTFNRGFGFGFLFLGWIFRLIPIALFGLLIFGAYQLGKRAGRHSTPPQAPVEAAPASTDGSEPSNEGTTNP